MVKVWTAVVALIVCFVTQAIPTKTDSEADPLLVDILANLCLMFVIRVVSWQQVNDVFSGGMKMTNLVNLVIVTVQDYVSVLKASGQTEPLVQQTFAMLDGSKALTAMIMLVTGLIITIDIDLSFSTPPTISAIYVSLCMTLGFSPITTVSIIGTAGVSGDAGSPASDSTLDLTAGLNTDGRHGYM